MLILTQHSPEHPYYLPTQCSGVLLEKLTGFQLVKKFPAFYGTRSLIAAFTIARHLSLPNCTTDFNNICKIASSPKYVFIWLRLIMMRKNFPLFMYLMSILRLYSLIILASLKMCAVGTLIGTLGKICFGFVL